LILSQTRTIPQTVFIDGIGGDVPWIVQPTDTGLTLAESLVAEDGDSIGFYSTSEPPFTSQVLMLSGFEDADGNPFTIPSGHPIVGIEVGFNTKQDSDIIHDYAVCLVASGMVESGTNRSADAEWGDSYAMRVFGGNTDLWSDAGERWSPGIVNTPGFGIALMVIGAGGIGYLDNVYLTIYYEEDSSMTIEAPALSGSESLVGLTREANWGTTPVAGSDPNKTVSDLVFIPIKEESIQANISADPQTDDMSANREILRIVENGATNGGSIRLTPGPESIGYFLTMMFGTPQTSKLHDSSGAGSDNAVYEHVWEPGANDRDEWPASFTIESIYANFRSKLIQGALCSKLNFDLPNNAAASLSADIGIAKSLMWLGRTTDGKGSGTTDGLGRTRPAVMTESPAFLEEKEFHFTQLAAFPEIDGAAVEEVLSLSLAPGFVGFEGLFTGGSGLDIGTYRVDNFQITGNITMLFKDEEFWETIREGGYFNIDATLQGELLQGTSYNSFRSEIFSAKCVKNDNVNKVGNLEYNFDWSARRDPVEGVSCRFTVVNSVASYA
jgi:hypothetical protein